MNKCPRCGQYFLDSPDAQSGVIFKTCPQCSMPTTIDAPNRADPTTSPVPEASASDLFFYPMFLITFVVPTLFLHTLLLSGDVAGSVNYGGLGWVQVLINESVFFGGFAVWSAFLFICSKRYPTAKRTVAVGFIIVSIYLIGKAIYAIIRGV